MAWRKRSSALLQTRRRSRLAFQPVQIGDVGQKLGDEIVSVHLHAVETDVADFPFELADVVYFLAQAAAQVFNLAGGKTHFQQLVGDGLAVFEVVRMLAAAGLQCFDHQAVVFADAGKMFQYILFQFFEIDAVEFFGRRAVFFVRFFAVALFFRRCRTVGRFAARRDDFEIAYAQLVHQHFVGIEDGFHHVVHFGFAVAYLFDECEDFGNRARTR